jgi:hypothetical protein
MIDEVGTVHSPTGASGADRWFACPGSVAAIAALPPTPPRKGGKPPIYRLAGSEAHALAALALNSGRDVVDLLDVSRWPNLSLKDAAPVQYYIDWVLTRKALLEERYDRVELRVEIRIGEPKSDFYGTVDSYLLAFEGDRAVYCEVVDFKNGSGVVVAAENNKQLMYYGVGVQRLHPEVDLFCLAVIQPNKADFVRPDQWMISSKDLKAWATNELFPAIMKTKEKDAPLHAGPWCRFCPANETCKVFEAAGGRASLPQLFTISKEASTETKAKWTKALLLNTII